MQNPAGSSVRRTRGVITISYYVPFRDIIRLRPRNDTPRSTPLLRCATAAQTYSDLTKRILSPHRKSCAAPLRWDEYRPDKSDFQTRSYSEIHDEDL